MFFHCSLVLVLTSTLVSSGDYPDSSSSSSSSEDESSSESKCACGNPCSNSVEYDDDYSETKGSSSDVSDTVPDREDTVYTVFTDSKKNWYEAFADCQKRGLDLATIENEREYTKLYSKIEDFENRANGEDFWLSGKTSDDGATFQWLPSRRNVTYNKWHRSQPDHDVGCVKSYIESCIEINKRFNNEWNDYCCEYEQFYICQNKSKTLITDSRSA